MKKMSFKQWCWYEGNKDRNDDISHIVDAITCDKCFSKKIKTLREAISHIEGHHPYYSEDAIDATTKAWKQYEKDQESD